MLQNKINDAARWAEENSLKYNASKVRVMHHSSSYLSEKNVRSVYYLGGTPIQSTTLQKDVGLWTDENFNFIEHHKRVSASTLTAALNAKKETKGCSYAVKKVVWDSILLPRSCNGMIIAAANCSQQVIDLHNRAYRAFFSKSKMGQQDQIAYPAEMSWSMAELKWIWQVQNGKKSRIDASQHIASKATTSSSKHGSPTRNRVGPIRTSLQRRLGRACNSTHPQCLSTLYCQPAYSGSAECKVGVVARSGRLIGDVFAKDPSSWPSVKQEITRSVFPKLYSNQLVEKLREGTLISQPDLLAERARRERSL